MENKYISNTLLSPSLYQYIYTQEDINTCFFIGCDSTMPKNKRTLTQFADLLASQYSAEISLAERKTKGQVFTPMEISMYMANMVNIEKNKLHILDPGAGTGILTAALCDNIMSLTNPKEVYIDVYEIDRGLLPILEEVMKKCQKDFNKKGHILEYNIFNQDFIMENSVHFNQSNIYSYNNKKQLYDIIISNPPYYKLNKDSPQSILMSKLVSGQPNIYSLFMAISLSVLSKDGEMVFITPRSFCSGLYYKKFRKWFIENSVFKSIHIFESRKEVFKRDSILQENIIIKVRNKSGVVENSQVTITSSKNTDFSNIKEVKATKGNVFYRKNGDIFIRIPSSPSELKMIEIVDHFPNTLKDLDMEISTGPVVPFRAKPFLYHNNGEKSLFPLLWMHNMDNLKIKWPHNKNKKQPYIKFTEDSKSLFLPLKNYVLLNRFSSKEQKRRLISAVLLKTDFKWKQVGIENHVNYIYKKQGELSKEEALGLSAYLNTEFIDAYFRSLNGSTQVNATDIRSLPFPDLNLIKEIGKEINSILNEGQRPLLIDKPILKILEIDFN